MITELRHLKSIHILNDTYLFLTGSVGLNTRPVESSVIHPSNRVFSLGQPKWWGVYKGWTERDEHSPVLIAI